MLMYKFGSSVLGSMVLLSTICTAISFELVMGQSPIAPDQAVFTLVGVCIAFYQYSLLSQSHHEAGHTGDDPVKFDLGPQGAEIGSQGGLGVLTEDLSCYSIAQAQNHG